MREQGGAWRPSRLQEAAERAPRTSERSWGGQELWPSRMPDGQAGRLGGWVQGAPPTLSAAEGRANLAGFPDATPSRQGHGDSPISSDVFGSWMRAPRKPMIPEGASPQVTGRRLASAPGGPTPGRRAPWGQASELGPCTQRAAQSPGTQAGGSAWHPCGRAVGQSPAWLRSQALPPAHMPPAPRAPLPFPRPMCPSSLCR